MRAGQRLSGVIVQRAVWPCSQSGTLDSPMQYWWHAGRGKEAKQRPGQKGPFWSNWVLWVGAPLIRDLLQESGFMVSKQWDFRGGICSPLGFHSNLSVISEVLSWLSAAVFLCFKSDYGKMETLQFSIASVIFAAVMLCCQCGGYAVWCARCGVFVRTGVCLCRTGACLASMCIFSSWCFSDCWRKP